MGMSKNDSENKRANEGIEEEYSNEIEKEYKT